MSKDNIIEPDQVKCSLCGETRKIQDLNGINPLPPIEQKYLKAFCKNVFDCDSDGAREKIALMLGQLNRDN
ncbi:hypothetical protein QUF70_17145 [Desulfobacterales bacterium HSG17]|nr:hypothetical protein [Desulfobacterales bacterium HSG17]